jgi:hypothetical protein
MENVVVAMRFVFVGISVDITCKPWTAGGTIATRANVKHFPPITLRYTKPQLHY